MRRVSLASKTDGTNTKTAAQRLTNDRRIFIECLRIVSLTIVCLMRKAPCEQRMRPEPSPSRQSLPHDERFYFSHDRLRSFDLKFHGSVDVPARIDARLGLQHRQHFPFFLRDAEM